MNGYAARQRERDENYRREYAAWVASLPEEERKQLESLGVDAPSLPGPSGGTLRDAATSSRARCEDEHIGDDDGEEDAESDHLPDEPEAADHPHQAPDSAASSCPVAPQAADDERIHDLLRRLVGELISQDETKLSLECLALVTGLTYDGDSMTGIARRHGVTRAAVSKRCVELTHTLNLKPSRAMRSHQARHSYRKSRTLHLRHAS